MRRRSRSPMVRLRKWRRARALKAARRQGPRHCKGGCRSRALSNAFCFGQPDVDIVLRCARVAGIRGNSRWGKTPVRGSHRRCLLGRLRKTATRFRDSILQMLGGNVGRLHSAKGLCRCDLRRPLGVALRSESVKRLARLEVLTTPASPASNVFQRRSRFSG